MLTSLVNDKGVTVAEHERMGADGSVNVQEYRRTLGAFMTGVTVVTTTDKAGRPRGMTMNSFTSVSLDPPLVLVCVDFRAASYEAFRESEGIGIHILSSDQQELAINFASKSPDKFVGIETVNGSGGAPIIPDVHAWIDCTTEQVIDAGDHAIILGRVRDYDAQDRRPLAFYQGKFNSFGTDEEIVQQQANTQGRTNVRWVIESADERLAICRHDDGSLELPGGLLNAEQLSDSGLSAAASEQLGSKVEIDFLYSLYDGKRGDPILVYRGRIVDDVDELNQGFVLIPTSEAEPDLFSDQSEIAVIERYGRERVGAVFGIYAGSQHAGTVASLGEPQRRDREGETN